MPAFSSEILHSTFCILHLDGPPFSRSVAQSLERAAWDREVAGGNPAVPTISNCCRGRTYEASVFQADLVNVEVMDPLANQVPSIVVKVFV